MQCSAADNPILRVSGKVVSYSNNKEVLTHVQTYPESKEDPFHVSITPNPVNHQMNISTDYGKGKICVHILNAQGVEVRNFVMDKQTTIDVSDLPSGLYLVNLIGGKVVTKKVVVQ